MLGWFKDLLNEDKAIGNVSFEDVRDFRDALVELPRNLSKFSKFDGLRIADALVVGKDDPKISSKTAQKYFQLLRAFFSWCAENNYLHEVPAPKLKILHSANPADARHPYPVKQLQSLLVSPLYVGHTKKARHRPGEYLYMDGRYWVPLLAMFSGARAGELLQLYDDDIIQVGDIWCIDINADKNKSLKTMSSVRRIPIHSQILKLGFLDFVEDKQTKSKTGRLFEEFPIQAGSVANAFSKWYRRFSVKIEIYSSKTPFHAFRHNFKDALVQAGTPDSVVMAILGHKNTSVTAQYGSGIAVVQLSEWIEKISLGLSFDHLKPYQGKQTPVDKPV